MAWSNVLRFDDPSSYSAAVQAVTTEILPTARGEFRGALTQIRMDRLWMQRFEVNLPQVSSGVLSVPRQVFAFLSHPTSGQLHYNGLNIQSGDIACGFDTYHVRSEADLRLASLSLPSDELPAICKTLLGSELFNFSSILRPAPDLMARLSILHNAIGRLAHEVPDLLHAPEVGRALEHEITHLLVRCLAEGVRFEVTTSIHRRSALIARFEAFLDANPGKPLYLTEICAALGTAERSLRGACEEHLGMGPIRFLTLRRMHLVRQALIQADPLRDTVTRIVTDYGFWELGRFSVAYRALFGETPSITLRQPAKDTAIKLNRPSSLPRDHSGLLN